MESAATISKHFLTAGHIFFLLLQTQDSKKDSLFIKSKLHSKPRKAETKLASNIRPKLSIN